MGEKAKCRIEDRHISNASNQSKDEMQTKTDIYNIYIFNWIPRWGNIGLLSLDSINYKLIQFDDGNWCLSPLLVLPLLLLLLYCFHSFTLWRDVPMGACFGRSRLPLKRQRQPKTTRSTSSSSFRRAAACSLDQPRSTDLSSSSLGNNKYA